MRLLTMFILSLTVCLFGILFAVFPHLWLIDQPWRSPLVWGGAFVFSSWMICVRSVSGEAISASPVIVLKRKQGLMVIMMAGMVTYAVMEYFIL